MLLKVTLASGTIKVEEYQQHAALRFRLHTFGVLLLTIPVFRVQSPHHGSAIQCLPWPDNAPKLASQSLHRLNLTSAGQEKPFSCQNIPGDQTDRHSNALLHISTGSHPTFIP